MILRIYEDDEIQGAILKYVYGGNFNFEYAAEEPKYLRVKVGEESYRYKCDRLDVNSNETDTIVSAYYIREKKCKTCGQKGCSQYKIGAEQFCGAWVKEEEE